MLQQSGCRKRCNESVGRIRRSADKRGQGALARAAGGHRATHDAGCAVRPVNGAAQFAGRAGVNASAAQEKVSAGIVDSSQKLEGGKPATPPTFDVGKFAGIFAAIGYLIFGVKDWGMWGFVTGVFAFFPLVGTMIIWVPLVIYLYTGGHNITATGLTIYSIVVTGNIDYITRLGLLKKIGNVHPMITVLGVIVGLKLFGFMGLIFGPLLISYFIILLKIYVNEFAIKSALPPS